MSRSSEPKQAIIMLFSHDQKQKRTILNGDVVCLLGLLSVCGVFGLGVGAGGQLKIKAYIMKNIV